MIPELSDLVWFSIVPVIDDWWLVILVLGDVDPIIFEGRGGRDRRRHR